MDLRANRKLILIFLSFVCGTSAHGEIITLKKVHGREIGCLQGGLRGAYSFCGADTFYSNVLVGKILSVTALPNDESRLIIAPEEVFRGDHPQQLEVITNQGLCIGDFRVGDRWLFFLFHADGGKGLMPILEYAHGSAPINEAQDELALLRRQASNSATGIIRGTLSKKSEPFAVPGQVVTLRSAHGAERQTITDSNGQFEFDLLPPSSYVLGRFGDRSKSVEIKVEPQGCYSTGLQLSPSGKVIWAW